jgi:purine-binding chemotaxis protein CheW
MKSAETKTKTTESREPEVQRQIVAFRVGEEVFGLEIGNVREVIEYREVTPVPRAPEFVAGIISLRGTILPVVDLRKRIGMEPTEPGPETVILVLEVDGRRVGLVADRILDILKAGPERALRTKERRGAAAQEYIQEILKMEDRVVILLRVDKLISTG